MLHELSPQRGSLEEAFMELTKGDVQFHAPATGAPGTPGSPGWAAPPGTAPAVPSSQQNPWAVSDGSPR